MGLYAPTPPENTPSAWSREGKRGLGQRQLIHQQRLYHALCHHQRLHCRETNQRHGSKALMVMERMINALLVDELRTSDWDRGS